MRSRASRVPVALVVVCAAGLGCGQHAVSSPFPAGLEPLENDDAPPPAATADDPYPETIDVRPGKDDTSPFVHATGYVHASVADTWSAFKDPTVVVDSKDISSYTVTWNVEAQYEVSFLTHYEIDKVVTVEFDLTWREGLVSGTDAEPTAVSVVYQKTFGSSYINLMKGSFELSQVTPTVTKIEFAQRLDASQTTAIDIAKWTAGLYGNVVARVHGQPLP